jgi:CubicO group peptidase (beta-lactamase class C family)
MKKQALLLGLAFTLACGGDGGSSSNVVLEPKGDLGPYLLDVVENSGVPAIGAYAFDTEGAHGSGVAGLRRSNAEVQVDLDDRWHLGSNTKAMSAMLAARLDALGILALEATLADAFPELAVDPGYTDVTLSDLLMHRGGAPESGGALLESVLDAGTLQAQRAALAAEVLGAHPAVTPGTYGYSNVGYIIAGAALEAATGRSWESLMTEYVFDALDMSTCGFGPPDVDADLSEPWGHLGAQPIAPGPEGDNPPVLGPAGTVHCSLEDWAKFATDQLRGARGEPALLPEAAYRRLHTPPEGGEYALGWAALPVESGVMLTHTGSNTNFSSLIFLIPHTNRGLLIVANRGDDDETLAALDETAAAVAAALSEM